MESIQPGRQRRGRPPKFGRPAQLATLTLPDDVLAWLKTLHPDPAWAIVKLHEQAMRRTRKAPALAELVPLPERRALILVNLASFRHLPGVSIIPMAEGRGLLALEPGRGVADLEIAVIDHLESSRLPARDREALLALRARLREWRQQGVQFESRAIIVATGVDAARLRAEPDAAPARPARSRHAG